MLHLWGPSKLPYMFDGMWKRIEGKQVPKLHMALVFQARIFLGTWYHVVTVTHLTHCQFSQVLSVGLGFEGRWSNLLPSLSSRFWTNFKKTQETRLSDNTTAAIFKYSLWHKECDLTRRLTLSFLFSLINSAATNWKAEDSGLPLQGGKALCWADWGKGGGGEETLSACWLIQEAEHLPHHSYWTLHCGEEPVRGKPPHRSPRGLRGRGWIPQHLEESGISTLQSRWRAPDKKEKTSPSIPN